MGGAFVSDPVIEFSDSRAAISKALFVMQANLEDVKKNAKNPHFQSRYADLGAVVEAVSPALEKAKLTLLQGASGMVCDGDYCTVVETMLLHESGEFVRSRLLLKPSKQDPQGAGSAITYGRRYGLQSLCGVCPEDDDGNKASVPREPRTVAKIGPEIVAKFAAFDGSVPPDEIVATIKSVQSHYKHEPTGLVADLFAGDEARDAWKFLDQKRKEFVA
jgi:hypothetical protein